ncbi:MAG: OmpH family outer membrane protein [Raineya sp.]|nr:OmpH family outer membrane protein [Raineya sp.]
MKKLVFFVLGSMFFWACGNKSQNNAPQDLIQNKNRAETKTDLDKSIVYVISDSVIANYELYKKSVKEFEVKRNQYTGDIENQANAFQNKVLQAQQKAQSMTLGEIEATKKSLAAEEQRLMQYRETLLQNLANQEKEMVEKINKNIDDFMKRYAEKNGYKMILGYKQGITAWYGDSRLDITADVIRELNEEYRKAQSGTTDNTSKETKKDSAKK